MTPELRATAVDSARSSNISGDADGAGEPVATGDGRVDAIVARLRGVEDLPLRDQVAVFEAVHVDLQDYVADAAQ